MQVTTKFTDIPLDVQCSKLNYYNTVYSSAKIYFQTGIKII